MVYKQIFLNNYADFNTIFIVSHITTEIKQVTLFSSVACIYTFPEFIPLCEIFITKMTENISLKTLQQSIKGGQFCPQNALSS